MKTIISISMFLLLLGLMYSCSKKKEYYTDNCTLTKIKLIKPDIDWVFEKTFEYDDYENMTNVHGYTLYPGHEIEDFIYEYDLNHNLIKITGDYFSPRVSNDNEKVYVYNEKNEIVERYDFNYYGNLAFGNDWSNIDTFYFSHENDQIKGVKYHTHVNGYPPESDWEYVDYSQDTTYFLLSQTNKSEFLLKIYDADSMLIFNESIEYIIDDKKNPFYNKNISFNKLIYLFEQTSVNIRDKIKMPNFGEVNIVYPSLLNDHQVGPYAYEYSIYGYPTRLKINDLSYEYVYSCQ